MVASSYQPCARSPSSRRSIWLSVKRTSPSYRSVHAPDFRISRARKAACLKIGVQLTVSREHPVVRRRRIVGVVRIEVVHPEEERLRRCGVQPIEHTIGGDVCATLGAAAGRLVVVLEAGIDPGAALHRRGAHETAVV